MKIISIGYRPPLYHAFWLPKEVFDLGSFLMILPEKRPRENNDLHRFFYAISRGLSIALYRSPLFIYSCHNMEAMISQMFSIQSLTAIM